MAGAPLRGLPSVAEAARALNAGLLRVATALDAAPHSAHFQRPVSTVAVPDYRSFVRAEDEVCLARVQARARDCDYPSVAAFRADITGIFHNAVAYNSPGCGAHAYEPVIHWARALVVAVEAELQRHREPLAQAEAQLQVGEGGTTSWAGWCIPSHPPPLARWNTHTFYLLGHAVPSTPCVCVRAQTLRAGWGHAPPPHSSSTRLGLL